MFSIKHVLLQGNENFLDRTKSVALYGKLYWVRYRALSNQIQIGSNRYKCPKTGRKCWLAPFVPDDDCSEFIPVVVMYEGKELGCDELE